MANTPEKEIQKIFGEVLRTNRVSKSISQEELAFRAGVDRTFISRIERGLRQPTITSLINLGPALETTAARLVAEAETIYRKNKNR